MTTVNPTYLLIRSPSMPVSVRCRAVPQGRDITNSQVTAEQTAAIIEREVGRLLQLALAAAQVSGVTPAAGSVYALALATAGVAPTASENAAAVRANIAAELARLDVAVSSRLAALGYTAPDNAGIGQVVAALPSDGAKMAGEGSTAKNLDQVSVDISGLATATGVSAIPSAVRAELGTELGRIDAAVSSRLPTAGYTAPDNAGIAALPTLAEIVSAIPDAPTAADAADAVWSHLLEAGLSAEAIQRILLAALVGKTAGVGSSQETYLAQDGTTPRIVADFDTRNNRTNVAIDGAT